MVPALSGLVLALVVLLAVLVLAAALVCLLLVAAFILVLLLERAGVDVRSAAGRRRAMSEALPAVPPLLPRRRPRAGSAAGAGTGTGAAADGDRMASAPAPAPAPAPGTAGAVPSGTIQQTAGVEPEAAAPTEPFRRPVTRPAARPSAAAPSSASADTGDDVPSTPPAQNGAPRIVPTRSRPVRRPRPPASPEVAREREAAMDRLFAPLTEDDRTRPLPRAGADQRAED